MEITSLKNIEFSKLIKIVLTAEKKLTGKLVNFKDGFLVQFESITDNKAFHENVSFEDITDFLEEKLKGGGNLVIITAGKTFEYKVTKKGRLLENSFVNKESQSLEEKKHILPLDIAALKDLDITTADGRIKNGMYDKFVQIDRFTQTVDEVLGGRKKIRIIDSGCGKAYLTFVVYHYLKFIKKIDVEIVGIDLKNDVVEKLNALAKKYNHSKIQFICADIKTFDFGGFDMLISLHACDKATDYTLYNAIKGGVEIILSVPCCQKEINSSFDAKTLKILNRYGLIKERVSALITDAIRAQLLTACGYKTKITEFISLDHSPKNIMIKAIKAEISDEVKKQSLSEAEAILNETGATQELYTLIKGYK